MPTDADGARTLSIHSVTRDVARETQDHVAVEEPMEIRVVCGPGPARTARSLSVTMRTPGHDFELAAGFLFTERILSLPDQIRTIEFSGPPAPGLSTSNIVRVDMDTTVDLDLERLQRNFFTTSSCGICGKASLEAIEVADLPALDPDRPKLRRDLIHHLPGALRSSQPLFETTGGLHAAALVDALGRRCSSYREATRS